MRIAVAVLVWLSVTMAPGCLERGARPTTAPSPLDITQNDPLPRLVDNLPGENHFANIIQLTDGGDNRRPFWGPTGQRLGFSSMRPPHSSREQYVVAIDGSGLLQVTGDGVQPPAEPLRWAQLGDGQVATSPDGLQVCFHGYRDDQNPEAEVKRYNGPVPVGADGPGQLDVYIASADGSGVIQVVSNGAYNCSPCFAPDGKNLIFSSDIGGTGFDLYRVGTAGEMLEKVTTAAGFDGDPVFSPDGRRLLFISQRNDQDPQEFNIFVADWLLDE
ncbi:MAG: hypothetical protein VX764_07115 [Planctomycetota bacterium]|nr:hypothetical protein [Planctomycetota bacterium]